MSTIRSTSTLLICRIIECSKWNAPSSHRRKVQSKPGCMYFRPSLTPVVPRSSSSSKLAVLSFHIEALKPCYIDDPSHTPSVTAVEDVDTVLSVVLIPSLQLINYHLNFLNAAIEGSEVDMLMLEDNRLGGSQIPG